MVEKTLAELAGKVEATIQGDSTCVINGISALQSAQSGQLSFLDNPKYRKYLPETKASAVILTEDDLPLCPCHALVVKNPYYAYSQLAAEFSTFPSVAPGIHASVIIGEGCKIDPSASIAAQVVLGEEVVIGPHTQIGSGSVIEQGCKIGAYCTLHSNVTLCYGVCLADRVIVHSGVVIGSDGFGLAQYEGSWHKIPQLGTVFIQEDVEIGANTTIDRGALEDTILEKGVKLDNQIQVGHNVRIGEHTVIAGCVGIAGSTRIGKYCMIGGATAIGGHIEIVDRVVITGMSMINNSIKEPGIYSSGTGFMKNSDWKKSVARFRMLDKIAKGLQEIKKLVK